MRNARKRRFRWYMVCVLAYYRGEWTAAADDDLEYGIAITKELRQLIRGCWFRKTPVPNAAKEVEIFLNLPQIIEGMPPDDDCGRDAGQNPRRPPA